MENYTSLPQGDQWLVKELTTKYHAEKNLAEVIVALHRSATTPNLKETFSNHLQQINDRIQHMEEVLDTIGQTYGFSFTDMHPGLPS